MPSDSVTYRTSGVPLRTTVRLGTHPGKERRSTRTAQAAMRHSSLDLIMNVYTDPTLLDVGGALEARPSLSLEDCEAGLSEVGTDRSGRGSADRRAYQATVTSTGSPTRM